MAAILALDSHDAMLAMLPPFHTLGLTGNIVLPLCFGVPVVFHANPTEGARLDAVCRQWRPTLLVAAPTFLDGMLRQGIWHRCAWPSWGRKPVRSAFMMILPA